MKKLKGVKQKVKIWNKEVFRDVRVAKGQILEELVRLNEKG